MAALPVDFDLVTHDDAAEVFARILAARPEEGDA